MHILLATDAQWILNEIVAVLGTPSTSFTVVSDGRDVSAAVKTHAPDLAILDLQSGSMGAMAVAMNLRLDHSSGNAPMVPVLMLLDRVADVHLARRSGADGWIIKPLDALRLRRAVTMVLDGDVYQEGLPTNADALTNQ